VALQHGSTTAAAAAATRRLRRSTRLTIYVNTGRRRARLPGDQRGKTAGRQAAGCGGALRQPAAPAVCNDLCHQRSSCIEPFEASASLALTDDR